MNIYCLFISKLLLNYFFCSKRPKLIFCSIYFPNTRICFYIYFKLLFYLLSTLLCTLNLVYLLESFPVYFHLLSTTISFIHFSLFYHLLTFFYQSHSIQLYRISSLLLHINYFYLLYLTYEFNNM